MDDYLDQYFCSSSWPDVDVNVKERSSWPAGSLGVYQDDKNNVPVSLIGSNHGMEGLAAHGTSLGVVEHGLMSGEGGPQMGLQFNGDVHCSGSTSLGSLKGLRVVGDMTSSQSFNERGNVMCNGGESSEFQRSLTLSPIPQLWHPQPYDGLLSSLPTLMGQTRMQSSCLRGDNGNADDRFVEIDTILQPENLSASINGKGKQDGENPLYSSCPSDCTITKTMIGLPSLLQSSSPTPSSTCNGTGKPRVRARRGQATDPHSIAERLRREKIAERMKNLQELVPNSNKTDKASMLDEIIEYVKFLQLQVKVLSMSRLGAAGAVVPLITDSQAEGSNGLTLTPLVSEGVDHLPSPEQVVFEQEVVKLMESNVTKAMQYLQTKGLCLMPIALAAAISNGKASSSSPGPASEERNGSLLSGVGIHQLTTSDGEFMIEKINGCNGTFKQEDVNTLCTAK
ncbi:hypothetical protein HRI_003163700 [Hibiscus trionum]|uniref:BHLH domain-containing protein n=1 Tax=Hibiscus trionum TaxID=183268 RepID=A0A9W7IF67_HIBTR|nr:hypothetical protein HRI_003163700 [Hibiscus trionum]